ncbi:MAG: outer membrane protein assembly factor BamB [Verrucomicrobiales bacterium]|jgi:outer membrane protein assembly factor BamB
MKIASTLLLFVASTLTPLSAEDWPNWRGPSQNGISSEKGLNFDWPEDGPKLVWQVDGCGKGYASVSVSQGNIFTIGNKNGGEHLTAFDEKSGMELWSTKFGTSGHSNGTPTVDGDFVYAIGRDGDLICCKTSNGEIVWQKRFDKDFGGKMMSGWGYSESPLIDGDHLICTPGGKDNMIVALDKKTGEKIWGSKSGDDGDRGKDGAGYSTVVISEAAGVKQYIQLTGRGIISVRAKDGRQLWNYNRIANNTANIPTPIVTGDHVFCSTGYGTGSALLKLSKKGATGVKAEEVYFLEADTLQNHHGGMIRIGKHIYTGHKHNNGFPICVDITTGDIIWGGDERGPGSGSAAITAADGHLIFRYQNGIIALIEATPDGYNLKAQFKPVHQEKESWAHPVIANGKLILREQDKLMCYDLSK